MLTDEEVAEIKAGVALGLRGPITLRWVAELLRDRDERIQLERKKESEQRTHTDGPRVYDPPRVVPTN